MRFVFPALIAAVLFSSSAHADRLFAIEFSRQGAAAVGVTVCLGTENNPAAFGGAVTDDEGRVVLTYPDRGPRLQLMPDIVLRAVQPDGPGVLARLTARSEESDRPEITSVRIGVPVTCGDVLPVSAAELLSDEERSVLRAQRVNVDGVRVVPRSVDARRLAAIHERMVRSAIDAEEEALNRRRESEEIEVFGPDERCFGAVGNGCGWGDTGQFAFCTEAQQGRMNCHVNSGSWLHDECCYANPNGQWCGGDDSEPDMCSDELARGWDRMLFAPYTWVRWVDGVTPNRTGRVDRRSYCAPDGQVLPLEDRNYCCSRHRELNALEWAAFKTFNPLQILDGDLRICDRDGDVLSIIADD